MNTFSEALYDVTLRDGNHALRHSLSPSLVSNYCREADNAGMFAVEVGHGNGLGASSFLVGKSAFTDAALLKAARSSLTRTRLAVHTIPGFSTIERDLKPAIALGVDVFRVATHSSEADVAERHIAFLQNEGKIVQGVLMMSHMVSPLELAKQARIMQEQGADAVIIMDSAGYYKTSDVDERLGNVLQNTSIPVGFHAHNNLSMAVANALRAKDLGASILDGSTMGLGAGAGNAQLENLAANLLSSRSDPSTLQPFLAMSHLISGACSDFLPRVTGGSIESALAGAFSGYAPQVHKLSSELGIQSSDLWTAIGKHHLVAGQESMLREIAQDLMNL